MKKETVIMIIVKFVLTGLLLTILSVICILNNANTTVDAKEEQTELDIQFIMHDAPNDEALEVIENRNGALVIEIMEGTVFDDEGNGGCYSEYCSYYIEYDTEKFSKGDEVISLFVYNPETNYADDIIYRVDIKK